MTEKTKEKRQRERARRAAERARRVAERAKQRFKDLAIFGTLVIGVIVGVHYGVSGYGSAFTFAAAMTAMVITGFAFGIAALAIRLDKRRK